MTFALPSVLEAILNPELLQLKSLGKKPVVPGSRAVWN